MIWYAARIIAGGVVALVVAALIVFLCLDARPDGPFDGGATAARFASWLGGTLTGNFGLSVSGTAPVGALVAGRLAVTLPLIALGALITALWGVGLGLGAARGGGMLDRGLVAISRGIGLVPNFWLGMLLVIVLATTLHWLPASGFVPWSSNPPLALASLILPALTLGLPLGAILALRIRDAMVAAQKAPHVRAAQLRGMSARDAFRAHGVRHVLLAALAAAAPLVLSLATGSVIVETVFYLPGLGRLMLDGAVARDVVIVRAAILILMVISVVLYAALRLAAGWADPRISKRAPA